MHSLDLETEGDKVLGAHDAAVSSIIYSKETSESKCLVI